MFGPRLPLGSSAHRDRMVGAIAGGLVPAHKPCNAPEGGPDLSPDCSNVPVELAYANNPKQKYTNPCTIKLDSCHKKRNKNEL